MEKKIFKIFLAWKDEAEERWLGEMAQKGWGLKKFNCGLYTFEKMEPAEYIYKLDYKNNRKNDMDEYLAIFQEAGWEHAAQFSGWHYFRIKADHSAETPDIYSDTHSKAQKYRALSDAILYLTLSTLVIFFVCTAPERCMNIL